MFDVGRIRLIWGGGVERSHVLVDYLERHRFEPQPYPIHFIGTIYYVLKHEVTNLILSISPPNKSRNYNYGDEKNKEKKLPGLENWYQEMAQTFSYNSLLKRNYLHQNI